MRKDIIYRRQIFVVVTNDVAWNLQNPYKTLSSPKVYPETIHTLYRKTKPSCWKKTALRNWDIRRSTWFKTRWFTHTLALAICNFNSKDYWEEEQALSLGRIWYWPQLVIAYHSKATKNHFISSFTQPETETEAKSSKSPKFTIPQNIYKTSLTHITSIWPFCSLTLKLT